MTAPATGMSIARGQWSFLPSLVVLDPWEEPTS